MKRLILVASCLLLASPALAQETSGDQVDRTPSSQSGSTAGGSTQSADDRVICRRIEADTGSMIGSRRVCMTKREWRQHDRQR